MLNSLDDDKPLTLRNALIIELLLATGLRVSELSNILESNTSYLVDQMRDINLISAIIIARDTNPEFTTIEYIEKI